MKTLKNWCILCALMLGIAACSKEAQDAPQVLEPTGIKEGESIQVGSRDSIFVNFSIGANTEQLRLAQALDAEGVPASPFMEEKDVVIRFAVRKSYRVTYTDAVCKKVPGENKVTYKGIIRLPDLYAHIPPGSPRPPIDFNGHEIAGILLGEANGGTQFVEVVDNNTLKSIEQTELLSSESNIVRSKIPYVLDWTAFPLKDHGIQAGKQTLHFKPVGNLLRIQFHNQQTEAKALESFKIITNALVTQAKFDFTKQGSLHNKYASRFHNVASGSPIESLSNDFRLEKHYTLSTPIKVEAKTKSKWYYLWVMPIVPRFLSPGEKLFLSTQVVGRASDGKDYNMLAICSHLDEGSNKLTMSFKMPSTLQTAFKGGKLPLWYVAEYDVAPNGRSLTYTNTMPYGENYDVLPRMKQTFGYFTQDELTGINVSGYFIPEKYEMAVIHGIDEYHDGDVADRNLYFYRLPDITPNQDVNNTVYEHVLFPGETNLQQTRAIYKVVRDPAAVYPIAMLDYQKIVIYALRFMDPCGNIDRLTAYRYAFNNNGYYLDIDSKTGSNHNLQFEVSSVFLGSAFTGDINTISDPNFWSSRTDVVTRIFPMVGEAGGLHHRFSTTRRLKNAMWRQDNIQHSQISSWNSDATENPVRLMKNEFKTAQ